MTDKSLLKQLEEMPVIDPRGITNAGYRRTLNQLLREMHNRIETLEQSVELMRNGGRD